MAVKAVVIPVGIIMFLFFVFVVYKCFRRCSRNREARREAEPGIPMSSFPVHELADDGNLIPGAGQRGRPNFPRPVWIGMNEAVEYRNGTGNGSNRVAGTATSVHTQHLHAHTQSTSAVQIHEMSGESSHSNNINSMPA